MRMNIVVTPTLLLVFFFGLFVSPCVLLAELSMPDGFSCSEALSLDAYPKLLSNIDAKYKDMSLLAADFRQASYMVGLDDTKLARGHLLFSKPGKMNWVYEEPQAKQFVADGQTSWEYDADLRQVFIRDFSSTFSSQLPVAFLLGIGRVSEDFVVKSACRTSRGLLLSLSPKVASQDISSFSLLVDPKDFYPTGVRMVDVGGNETTIGLSGLVFNTHIDPNAFVFEIPKGVYIEDQRKR